MNITFLTISASRKAGGLFFSVKELAKTLSIYDVAVRVFAPKDEFTTADIRTWSPVSITSYDILGPGAYSFSPKLSNLLSAADSDIFHVHGMWMYNSFACGQHSRRRKIPYLISPRGMLDPWALKQSAVKKRLARFIFEDRFIANSCCVHALNLSELRSIRRIGYKGPICVIPNGMSIPSMPVSSVNDSSILHPAIRGRPILLYIGRIHPKKGLVNLIHAFTNTTKARHDDWTLCIAGWDQGNHEEDLKKLVNSLGVSQSVLFLGPKYGEEKNALLSQASAFVHTSFSEGLPMAILEGWASSLPVVMTEECNLPIGFERGAAIRVGTDIASIGKGLCTLFNMNDIQRIAMGAAGRALVEKEFTWDFVARETSEVYRWMLGGNRPGCVYLREE